MDINQGFYLLFAHYIADYPLQSDFLAQTKGKYWYSLMAHCFLYSMTIGIAMMLMKGYFSVSSVMVIYITHVVIDYCKANAKNKEKALTTYLYIDQSAHILINFIVFLF
jgi:hypothetical protein